MKNKVVDLYNHVSGHKGFDYDQVDDLVYLGTNMCCQFGFEKELLVKGVRADISLEKEKIDAPAGVDFFLWLPTEDGAPPSPDAFALGVETLEFFAKQNIGVYVHCKNGHGRGPTLLAAYYIKQGMAVDKAIDLIQLKRPSVHLTESQINALKNLTL